jgi:pyruvate/2-oxoglutarate dehydrogenase complex dihydrolipoamide dehydrogenase (E3) component
VMGTARFVAERTVEVRTNDGGIRVFRGRDVVVDTGSTPQLPDVPGLADADVWTSETILRLERLPATLVILGGGYIGCEFASMMAVFGSRVTLVQRPDRLLHREDPDVSAAVADGLAGQGVDVRVGAHAVEFRREQELDAVVVTFSDGSQLSAEELLVATGRAPVTGDLDVEKAGVELDARGFVVVDDHLRTTAEHVWAAGDVAGSPMFTHASWNDFRIVRANLTGGDAVTTGRLVPYTVFTTPELSRIGLTETQARAQGRSVTVAHLDVQAIPRAKTLRETVGHWKVVIDARTDELLGAALLGHESGEVIAALQMAMLGGLRYQQVRDAVITHPTMSEGLNLVFDSVAAELPG